MAMYKRCKYCNKKYEYGSQCECDGYNKAKQRQQNSYDKYVRKSESNKKYDDFYHSKEWKRFTEYIKAKYNNMCIMCLIREKKISKYDVVHHVYEIKTSEGWEHRLDSSLCIPLCHACHNELHSRYDEEKINDLIKMIKEYEEKF